MLRRCPKCRKDGGLVYCPVCHGVKRDEDKMEEATDVVETLLTADNTQLTHREFCRGIVEEVLRIFKG